MLSEVPSKESILSAISGIDSISDPIQGGQKIVYPVVIRGKKYALKVIPLKNEPVDDGDDSFSISVDDVFLRIKREVETLDECSVPQLVKLGPIPMSIVEVDDGPKIIYAEEWVNGRSIREMIRIQGSISASEVVRIGIDVTKAVKALWSVSKVHRDIKPENIIRRNEGGFVLLDLGFALDLDDISLTGSNLVCGTVPYYSPEQTDPANKRRLDFRSDLYSLGVVMLEALTGCNPFVSRDGSIASTVRSIQTMEIRPTLDTPEIPQSLKAVLLRMMAKEPHLRYRSCDVLLDSLNKVGKSLAGGLT